MKKKLKAIWNWFSGKKRTIAIIYWSLVIPALSIMWPTGAPPEISKTIALIGLILSFIGLGHAAVKVAAKKKAAKNTP